MHAKTFMVYVNIVLINLPFHTSVMKSLNSQSLFFTSSGRLLHARHPKYLKLCLKYSVLGLGGIKQDFKLILVFILYGVCMYDL